MEKFNYGFVPNIDMNNPYRPSLKRNALCVCDDDNDLEMALACKHAFLPTISSESMKQTVDEYSNQFTVTEQEGLVGTSATDKALELVLEQLPTPKRP